MKHRHVTERLKAIIDAPYELGQRDCLSVLLDFYGVPADFEYKGFTRENYAERYRAGSGKAELKEFLCSLGLKVEGGRTFAIAGDLMVFEQNGNAYGGIFLGNGNVLVAFKQGVKVLPVKFILDQLIEVRRCE